MTRTEQPLEIAVTEEAAADEGRMCNLIIHGGSSLMMGGLGGITGSQSAASSLVVLTFVDSSQRFLDVLSPALAV